MELSGGLCFLNAKIERRRDSNEIIIKYLPVLFTAVYIDVTIKVVCQFLSLYKCIYHSVERECYSLQENERQSRNRNDASSEKGFKSQR